MSINQKSLRNESITVTSNRSCSQEVCRFNRSRIPEGTTWMSDSCGYCDTLCTYRAFECIFTVGIIANVIVLFRVVRDRKLRNATFVSIAACATADMYFLIIYLGLSYEAVILTITCNYPSRFNQKTYKAMAVGGWFAANGHITLLAVVRYVILVYPIKSKVYLSIRRVLLLSGLVWALAVLSSVSTGALGLIVDIPRRKSYQVQITLWTTIYLAPVSTTVTLHLVKMYKIRQTTTTMPSELAKRRIQAMSRMVLLVIFVAAILPLPYVLDRLLRTFGNDFYGSSALYLHVRCISNLLVLLNHSINPMLYAFMSNPFRMSLKRMLGLD